MKVKHFFLILTLILCNISFVFAQEEKTQQDLVKLKQELARQKQEKSKLDQKDKEIQKVVSINEQKLITIASSIRESEKKINNLDSQLTFLNKQRDTYEQEMKEMQKEMSEAIAILQMFALTPQPILLETSSDISNQLTSAITLENSIILSEEKFKVYYDLIEKVEKNQEQISETKTNIDRNKKDLTQKQSSMKSTINEQTQKLNDIKSEKKQVESNIQKLAQQSRNLEEFLKKALAKKTAQDKYEKYTGTAPRLPKAPLPADGTIIQVFGEANENKIKSDGWKIRTGSDATVTSTHQGVVIFADYFKGYNKLIIIEHNQNFHTIIANLGAIYVQEGQNVAKGTPVGEVGQSRTVYLEIRYKNKPLNPGNYFIVN